MRRSATNVPDEWSPPSEAVEDRDTGNRIRLTFTNEHQGGLRPVLLFVLLAALERYWEINRLAIAGHGDCDDVTRLVILEVLHKV
jgi:hypothetical protein